MASICKQNWCTGLTAILSIVALLVSIYSIRIQAVDERLAKLEEKNDTIVELKTDMTYAKQSLTRIEAKLAVIRP